MLTNQVLQTLGQLDPAWPHLLMRFSWHLALALLCSLASAAQRANLDSSIAPP